MYIGRIVSYLNRSRVQSLSWQVETMKCVGLICSLLILVANPATGEDYPGCSFSGSRNAPLTSEAGTDLLELTISGDPCYEAILVLSIATKEGNQLYRYEAPFKPHVDTHWEDPGLSEDAERLLRRFLDHTSFSKTSELPKWMPKDDYYETNYQELQVDRSYYEMLLTQDWYVYTHLVHYEGWRVIAFDRQDRKIVVVSEGGL